MTTVINKRNKYAYDIYIGRGSKWGNPFRINNFLSRENAIEAYKLWIVSQPDLMASLDELRDKTLGCYCKPLPCHGDVLIELIYGKTKV